MQRTRCVIPGGVLVDVPRDRVREELADLATKYASMLRLRRAQDVDVEAGREHRPVRDDLRALSSRYPGALAEIDRLPLGVLESRLAEVEALRDRDDASVDALPTWVRGWIGVHRGLRGALAIKEWLRGRRTLDADTRAALDAALAAMRHADEARAWADAFDVIAAPPRGRLVDVVLDRVARELALERETLRALLWPPHPARNRSS